MWLYGVVTEPVALFTLALVVSTVLLWQATLRLASEARESATEQAGKMERSVKAADRTAAAAANQVKIAQDTAYRQLRAYIGVEPSVELVGPQIINCRIDVHNAGQTPARFKVFVGTWIGPFPVAGLPAEAPEPIWHGQHNPFVNARSTEIVRWFHPPSPSQNEQSGLDIANMIANPGTRTFYFYGRVEFTDFLKKERTLRFAFRRHGTPVIGQPIDLIPLNFGNEYVAEGE